MIKFNINDIIKIRLTDKGRRILRQRYDELTRYSPNLFKKFPYEEPEVDENGWSTWQMWEVMQIFGPHMGNGFDLCFDTVIQIIEKERK